MSCTCRLLISLQSTIDKKYKVAHGLYLFVTFDRGQWERSRLGSCTIQFTVNISQTLTDRANIAIVNKMKVVCELST